MIRLISAISLFLISISVHAEEVWHKVTKGHSQYLVIYTPDDKIWFVDHFKKVPTDLQDFVVRKEFPNAMDANSYALAQRFEKQQITKKSSKDTEGVVFPNVNRSLWTVTRSWTEQWEQEFENWFRTVFHPAFFVEYNIETDCADAAYIARWIFARQNQLPAAAQLAGSGQLITQDTVRPAWAGLPTHADWWQDQLFLAAINYLADNTYTHTLNKDTYPVAIDSTRVTSGAVYLTISGSSGHTRIFYEFGPSTKMTLLSSTIPKRVRPLFTENFRVSSNAAQGRGGVVKFLWPYKQANVWRLTEAEDMPGYSLEQYANDFQADNEYFYQAVQRRVFPDVVERDYHDMLAGVETAVLQIEQRLQVVQEGYEFCRQNDCAHGSDNYENWSTPSRDGRLYEVIMQISDLANYSLDPRVQDIWNDLLFHRRVSITEGLSLSWSQFLNIIKSKQYSSDPNTSLSRRWGVQDLDNFSIATDDPYQDRMDSYWYVHVPEGQRAKFYFSRFSTESHYDNLYISSGNEQRLTLSGNLGEFLSSEILSNGLVEFRFKTDTSVVGSGFILDRIDIIDLEE